MSHNDAYFFPQDVLCVRTLAFTSTMEPSLHGHSGVPSPWMSLHVSQCPNGVLSDRPYLGAVQGRCRDGLTRRGAEGTQTGDRVGTQTGDGVGTQTGDSMGTQTEAWRFLVWFCARVA